MISKNIYMFDYGVEILIGFKIFDWERGLENDNGECIM